MAKALVTKRRAVDFLTLSVAITILGGYVLWTLYFTAMPLWIAAPLGSILLTWYGSLQHETIHGHPTASRRVNTLIGGWPLSLWVPYAVYRVTHIRHHRHSGKRLTEVGHDPESFYLPPGYLSKVGPIRRALLIANCTLAGRVFLGPAIAIVTFWSGEWRTLLSNRHHRLIWFRHLLGVIVLLAWTVGVCDVPLVVYVFLVVYPSIALTHLRSFAEHKADDHSQLRTNVVEASPVWGLIFLNNNLHVAHHAHPHVPWYELPRLWRNMRRAQSGAGLIFSGGYWEVLRKYWVRPFITAEHPFSRAEMQ